MKRGMNRAMNRMPIRLASVAPVLLALAACAESTPVPDDTQETVPAAIAPAAQDESLGTIPAGDFADLDLGAKIVGPQGSDPSGDLTDASGRVLGTITSYVACPAGMDPCIPGQVPEGTLFTFVHTVVPNGEATGFRTVQPANGFTGIAGYDLVQARAAGIAGLGADGITIRCDQGALVWSADTASWRGPVTVFWQSASPPAGIDPRAYQLLAGATAEGPGPAPAAGGPNACMR